ncbi:MAG TPA: endo-1,4-beta-xylanase [Verrucomicrobiae bacterium]|nr:endo-1,4-beta-xylanase [Verrucomicrobiae bacterium]
MRAPSRVISIAMFLTTVLAANADAPATLKDAYKQDFFVGTAVNAAQFTEKDTRDADLVKAQFNSITPENALKWENIHPQRNTYAFDLPDKYVAFGEANHMFIVGHCLVWHNQIPGDVFRDGQGNLVTREVLLQRMRDHIHTVVGRYKGRINSWDVVNEALNEDGTLRQSLWLKIIGEDYIEKGFRYAHEADPQAQLTYNDYSLENEPKRNGAIALISKLKAMGVPITSVGLQGHDSLTWPSVEQQDATIAAFAKIGVKVVISELDIDVLPRAANQESAEITTNIKADASLNPYVNGLPDSVQQALAQRYAELFDVFLKHRDVISRVTFWGVTDGDSWRNDWPVKGRTSYPLLFDRHGQPKPAFDAVIRVAAGQVAR